MSFIYLKIALFLLLLSMKLSLMFKRNVKYLKYYTLIKILMTYIGGKLRTLLGL